MFEYFDYQISQERRKDLIRQADSARVIRSLEIAGRGAARTRLIGEWMLTLIRQARRRVDAAGSALHSGHHGLHSGSSVRSAR